MRDNFMELNELKTKVELLETLAFRYYNELGDEIRYNDIMAQVKEMNGKILDLMVECQENSANAAKIA